MTRFLLSASTLILVFSSPVLAAESLPLKRVTLSTAGLAQFEHHGTVAGNEKLTLPVRLDQVDDVLKSLVVLDNGGTFGGVSLPGREPLSTIFRDLPFDQSALRSPQALLTALQGAEVQVVSGADTMKGKLVSVAQEQSITKDGEIIDRHRVTVMTAEGLKSALLEDLKFLQFTEKDVQDQLNRALSAVYTNRVQDQRSLTLDLRGQGERPVTVSYVTMAPVWKSAYRLVLPEQDSNTAYLQGWAILENTTGQDWDDVTVTLLSGNPVTYKQSLYESYYLDRPFLPLRVMDRVMPRTDEGSMVIEADKHQPGRRAQMKTEQSMLGKSVRPAAPAMEMMAMADAVSSDEMAYAGGMDVLMTMNAAQSAITEKSVASMVFRFPQAVTLPAGNSMMLPVVSRDVPAEQLWLFQPETNARHPLTAVSLKNDGESALPTGILTLFEKGASGLRYTGDAELALLPKGDTRYVTFALDPATTIDRENSGTRQYGAFAAAKGIIRQKVMSADTTTYTIKAPADEPRVIVVEHPRRAGWTIKVSEEIEGDVEQTETHYRLRTSVEAGETKSLKVTMERSEFEQISLGYMSADDLRARMSAMGSTLDDKTRKALEGAIALQADVSVLESQINQIEQKRQVIFNDQQRLRENLESIPSGSDLAKRYLSELDGQEDVLKKIASELDTLQGRLNVGRKKLNDYIMGLEL